MQIIIEPDGSARCVYGETIDLSSLGELSIRRGSHAEPVDGAFWTADLSPVGGPVLGPFATRSDALAAEIAWLHENWLGRGGCAN